MDATELRPGLWRWTAPHPDWQADAEPESPDDWPREVGCVLAHAGDAAVFVDPLVPPDAEAFWRFAEERTAGRRTLVLTTVRFHRRSRAELAARLGASTSRACRDLPDGVETFTVRGAGETMVWVSEHRALVPGDRLLGAGDGELRLCPESWLRYLDSGMTLARLREALRPLLDLPVEMVLVSHGPPVLAGGSAALARALG